MDGDLADLAGAESGVCHRASESSEEARGGRQGELDRRRAIGRAAVAATLAATLATPGAVLAAEITEPDPVPIVQVVQMGDPPDNVQAAVTDDDEDKGRSGLSFFKKLLIGFAAFVLLVLLLVVTRCAGSFFGIGDALTDGSGADDGATHAVTLTIDDAVARDAGDVLAPVPVAVTSDHGATVIVERVEVGYGEPTELCQLRSGEYLLVILDGPNAKADQNGAAGSADEARSYRVDPSSLPFEVGDGDLSLMCTVIEEGGLSPR